MTIEEKRTAVQNHCMHTACQDCPLENCETGHCYSSATEDEVIENYRKIFGDCKVSSESNVSHPSHYNQGCIECIDAMVSAFGKEAVANFCLVNAFKYVWRNRDKNGCEDVDKAIWYLNKFKELVANE